MSSLLSKGYRLFQDGEYYGLEHREDTRRIDAEVRDQWANDPLLTAGLNYFYRGGVGWSGTLYTSVAAGSVALTDDDVNYVEHTLAGVVSANVVGFSVDQVPMAEVTTADGAITALVDRRSEPYGALVLGSALGVANGVATLDGSGLVPTSQMPPLVISEVFTVASEAAMLALAAERGDVAIRTDTNETYILSTDSPSTLADWKLIVFATSSGSVMFAADTRVLGRKTPGAGAGEELTLSEVLDFIGAAARGDLLVRGAATWARLGVGAAGKILMSDGTDPAYVDDEGFLPYLFEGGGAVISTGPKRPWLWGFKGEITRITLLADQAGDFVGDLWKDTYANYPPTVADTITAAAKPTLAAVIKSQDAVLTGWTKSFNKGDIVLPNVDSAATVQWVMMIVEAKKVA